MVGDLIIRPARPEDIPRMCELLADLFSVESDFEVDVVKQMKGLSMLVSDLWGRAFVAVADNSIVGMATVQTLISTAEGGRVGLVEDVIVDRQFRGRGVGTRLLEQIAAWGRENGLKRLQLLADSDNRPALEFYSSLRWISTRLICLRKLL
jgi:GNAT superfamily N-acetyltransferase